MLNPIKEVKDFLEKILKDTHETKKNEQEIKLESQETDHTLEQLYDQIYVKIENKSEGDKEHKLEKTYETLNQELEKMFTASKGDTETHIFLIFETLAFFNKQLRRFCTILQP